MTIQQRLINKTQAAPVKDYPWLEAAQTVDPKEAFYGSGFENMLVGSQGTHDERDYQGRRLLAAAIAANRVPLAGLGFDPHRESFNDDLLRQNTVGMYHPDKDTIDTVGTPYVDYPGSVDVHESIHRGIHILKHMDDMPYIADPEDNEKAVRVMMADLLGDPERLHRPEEYTQFVDQFNNPPDKGSQLLSKAFADQLGQVNQAAARAIALRRPGGPR